MGYTHYWNFKKGSMNAETCEKAYQKAIKEIHQTVLYVKKNVVNLSGYTSHSKIGQYGGIDFNGVKEEGHENFYLREHFNQNFDAFNGHNFCKTAFKSYDIVVTAALIVLKYRLKDCIHVESDGEHVDWVAGLNLAKEVLKLKSLKIPSTIRVNKTIKLVG